MRVMGRELYEMDWVCRFERLGGGYPRSKDLAFFDRSFSHGLTPLISSNSCSSLRTIPFPII